MGGPEPPEGTPNASKRSQERKFKIFSRGWLAKSASNVYNSWGQRPWKRSWIFSGALEGEPRLGSRGRTKILSWLHRRRDPCDGPAEVGSTGSRLYPFNIIKSRVSEPQTVENMVCFQHSLIWETSNCLKHNMFLTSAHLRNLKLSET